MPADEQTHTTVNPAFVVVDIPEPARSEIQSIRTRLNSLTAQLPIEVTLAGSSGLGPIPIGTGLKIIAQEIDRIASVQKAFYFNFSKVGNFPGTGIFFLTPEDRTIFDGLHQQFKGSKIPFSPSAFPYNPHCTLRAGAPVSEAHAGEIYSLTFPQSPILIDAISVYELNGRMLEHTLLHRAVLKK